MREFRLDASPGCFQTRGVSGRRDTDTAAEILELIRDEGIVGLEEGVGAEGDLFAAGLDSMAVMQLLVAVGERWGVMLEAGDVTKENFGTASALAKLVDARKS
jgi:acyl carrier protein